MCCIFFKITFYIGYIINDVESDYTTLVIRKTDVEKTLSTWILCKTVFERHFLQWFKNYHQKHSTFNKGNFDID